MKAPSLPQILDHWLRELGSLWVLAGCGGAAALLLALLLPTGAIEVLDGRIQGLGLVESETGSWPVANVLIGSRSVVVPLPRATRCVRDGAIRVRRTPHVWGASYSPDFIPCP